MRNKSVLLNASSGNRTRVCPAPVVSNASLDHSAAVQSNTLGRSGISVYVAAARWCGGNVGSIPDASGCFFVVSEFHRGKRDSGSKIK